jgi:hypothetical protein
MCVLDIFSCVDEDVVGVDILASARAFPHTIGLWHFVL